MDRAIEVMANSRNLKCPDNVSITGFNDTPMIDRIPPGLDDSEFTLVVGRIAAELPKKNERSEYTCP